MHLHDLFDGSLVGRADQAALELDDPSGVTTLTFGDLDQRADRVAHVLGLRHVPNRVDLWGPQHDHDWPTWREMLPKYLDELVD